MTAVTIMDNERDAAALPHSVGHGLGRMIDMLDDAPEGETSEIEISRPQAGGAAASEPPVGAAIVTIIIVGFRNAADIVGCLRALARLQPLPAFNIFIAENGGPAAVAALHEALVGEDGPCRAVLQAHAGPQAAAFPGSATFLLARDMAAATLVHVVPMPENLGYAGAINACLRPLLKLPGWHAAWVLNPDTTPRPTALLELMDYAETHHRGMVGSRITAPDHPDDARCRGLTWRKLTARTVAIGLHDAPGSEPEPHSTDAAMDSPSGASIYVTRDLITRIGLMDERYFLYFEDLEWGCRAKTLGELGYAHRSVVPHTGGTTIGSANKRAVRSRLAVYLDFRNRIIFVRDRHPGWLAWTVLMQLVHLASFAVNLSIANMLAGARGLWAGLRGEVGRPDHIMVGHATR
jgi:hypothetical protein